MQPTPAAVPLGNQQRMSSLVGRMTVDGHRGHCWRTRCGMAALEVVLITGAIFPLAVLVFIMLRQAMRLYHSLIGNIIGSPIL